MPQRPIKLKAWDKELGDFVPLLSLMLLDNPHPDLTIVQFTGVYDQKGREIWEGDILYYRCYNDWENRVYEHWAVVAFHNGAFCTLESDGEPTYFYGAQIDELVVGNIWENPHMMPKNALHYAD